MTAVDKTNDQRTLIPIMGIGQALVHYCSCIAAYVGDLPLYILLLDIIFALDNLYTLVRSINGYS